MIKRILALDISLSNTGFSVIDVNTKTCECGIVKIGSTNTTKIKERGEKLHLIYEQMIYLISYAPDIVVAEHGFSLHKKSTQALYAAVGVVQMALLDYDIVWYAPRSVKKIATGSGLADKPTIADAMMAIFEDVSFENYDESDSLAVAMTHIEQSEEFKNGS